MKHYLIPFIAYLIVGLIANYFLNNIFISYAISTIFVGVLIIIFWKHYKIKFRFDWLAVITGIAIFILWALLEKVKYPLFFENSAIIPSSPVEWVIRIIGFVVVTPIIEEVFTRGFLIRYLVDQNWRNVAVGKFTWLSFVITVLFFGLSHGKWLAGLAAGILLNLLYYRSKSVGSCIVAHGIANLLLLIFLLV